MAIGLVRSKFWLLVLLSSVLNLIALSSPIFLMLVYDSVLPSGNGATLAVLTMLVAIMYAGQAWFDMSRQRLLHGIANMVDAKIAAHLFRLETHAASSGRDMSDGGPIVQADQLRQFFTGIAPLAILDLPWVVLFMSILMLMHPLLALAALAGVALLGGWAWYAERVTVRSTESLVQLGRLKAAQHAISRRNSETVKALGIADRMAVSSERAHRRFVQAQTALAGRHAVHGSVGRAGRHFVQSAVLAVGALLVIDGNATGGIIFASSIIVGRALAPIDQIVTHWRSIVAARASGASLRRFLGEVQLPPSPSVSFKRPTASMTLERAEIVPVAGADALFPAFDLAIAPGEFVSIIGRSGAGKSSLVRTLAGITALRNGKIRLGGVAYSQWSEAVLGAHIGYLPQSVDLFAGKIAQNIARFDPEASSEDVIAAAENAGVHDAILALPEGYDTVIQEGGRNLAGGLCQRVGLARALYGNPALLVLDEPSSNLDPEGCEALLGAIQRWVKAKNSVIAVSHHRILIDQARKLLLLQAGEPPVFGLRDAVIAHADMRQRVQPRNVVDIVRGKGR